MDKKSVVIVALLAFMIGCGTAVVLPTLVVYPVNAAEYDRGWEYKCMEVNPIPGRPITTTLSERLTQEGSEKWQLVSVIERGQTFMSCLKREMR